MLFYYLPPFRKYREYMFFVNFHLEYHAKVMRLVLLLLAISVISGMVYLLYLRKTVSGLNLYAMVFSVKMLLLLLFLYLSFPYFKIEINSEEESGEKKIRSYVLLVLAFLLLLSGFLLGFDSFYEPQTHFQKQETLFLK